MHQKHYKRLNKLDSDSEGYPLGNEAPEARESCVIASAPITQYSLMALDWKFVPRKVVSFW